MEFRGVLVVFAAVAITAISAESVTFPEIARERSGSRIVSGWEAEDRQFPHQISLRMVAANGAVSSCGGSIIHKEWGLTAAHCTASRISFVIRCGVVNLTRPDAIFETTVFYNYPEYNNDLPSVVQPHDIGLLKFGRTLLFNDYIQPIRVQRSAVMNKDYEGVRLYASGWGRTWTNGASPENLNWVYLIGVTNLRCRAQYGNIIMESTICASGYNDTTQSTCQGDSGGPLSAVDDDGVISQIGVTSFVSGAGCHAGFPAGFIRPGHYHEWFKTVSGIDFDWQSTEDILTTPQPDDPTTPEPEEDSSSESEEDPTTPEPEEDSSAESEEDPTTPEPEEDSSAESEEDPTTPEPEETPEEWDPYCDEEESKVHFVNN